MVGKGRGSYFGANSIEKKHPVGFGKRKTRLNGSISWAKEGQTGEIVESRLLSPAEADKLRHVGANSYNEAETPPSKLQNYKSADERSKLRIGYGKKGFGDFTKKTNLLVEKFDLEKPRTIAAALNRQGWKTLASEKWDTKLVEIYLLLFFSGRPRRKQPNRAVLNPRIRARIEKAK